MERIKQEFREWRHSPCLMRPVSGLFIVVVVTFGIVLMAAKLPILLIGLLVAPVYHRLSWLVEFIYPCAIGKWTHLLAMKWGQRLNHNNHNSQHHSRCAETRIELIPNRLYVHPLPQFLDNLGYLVCILEQVNSGGGGSVKQKPAIDTRMHTRIDVTTSSNNSIIGIIVDCGQADAVQDQIQHICKSFYKSSQPIKLHAILSTHKHHDHTAGNDALKDLVDLIVGGAAESVPCCNTFLADQDRVPLPIDSNDISITAIAVPAHTRGSLTYALEYQTATVSGVSLFTGDTIFSGGGGVAFEADMNRTAKHTTAHSYIQATTTANAAERCFAQVLFHSTKNHHREDVLVFPGHEYSSELLSRQLNFSSYNNKSSSQHHYPQPRWKTLPPGDFFETAAAWYVADHRKEAARLLAVPSTIARELKVNPHFRSMQQRGIVIVHALRLWHWKFANIKVLADPGPYTAPSKHQDQLEHHHQPPSPRTESRQNQWNVSVADVQRPIFTTVYSTELQQVITDLQTGAMDAATAAERLQRLRQQMNQPVIRRRPVPGTNPSGRAVYRGLLALVLLGSPPTALCASDAAKLNLNEPNDSDSETIQIEKTRLIAVLHSLGLLNEEDGKQLVAVIHQLWREAIECMYSSSSTRTDGGNQDDAERTIDGGDDVELGYLKWVLYGIPRRSRQSFGSWCLPCRKAEDDRPQQPHPACRLLRHSGELVRHDIFSCPICRDATGNAAVQSEEVNGDTEKAVERTVGKRAPTPSTHDDDELEEGSDDYFIEVAPLDAAANKET